MFVLIPWKVDVPQERWPVMNWLIIVALIAVFALQVADALGHVAHQDSRRQGTERHGPTVSQAQPDNSGHDRTRRAPGITGDLVLQDWSLKRLFGHMWIHAGPLHLAGNLLFLWIFGNAVCAKIGNLRYLLLYVLCGVVAGIVQLSLVPRPSLGASGAINGVVGMYLVLFYENEITCLFLWLLLPYPYIRFFDVSSIWMILFWLFWDIFGALRGHAGVGYFAHLGGFASGFGIVMLLCAKGWITMERYEESLWQRWQKRRHPPEEHSLNADYARLGLPMITELSEPSPARAEQSKPIPLPEPEPVSRRRGSPKQASIRTACACGQEVTVSRQSAGRTIRCPACNRHLVIPQATDFFDPPAQRPLAPQMRQSFIRFACSCGRMIRVPARFAGRFGKCPQCGSRLKIPPFSA